MRKKNVLLHNRPYNLCSIIWKCAKSHQLLLNVIWLGIIQKHWHNWQSTVSIQKDQLLKISLLILFLSIIAYFFSEVITPKSCKREDEIIATGLSEIPDLSYAESKFWRWQCLLEFPICSFLPLWLE